MATQLKWDLGPVSRRAVRRLEPTPLQARHNQPLLARLRLSFLSPTFQSQMIVNPNKSCGLTASLLSYGLFSLAMLARRTSTAVEPQMAKVPRDNVTDPFGGTIEGARTERRSTRCVLSSAGVFTHEAVQPKSRAAVAGLGEGPKLWERRKAPRKGGWCPIHLSRHAWQGSWLPLGRHR